jgi:hypothetical protein
LVADLDLDLLPRLWWRGKPVQIAELQHLGHGLVPGPHDDLPSLRTNLPDEKGLRIPSRQTPPLADGELGVSPMRPDDSTLYGQNLARLKGRMISG